MHTCTHTRQLFANKSLQILKNYTSYKPVTVYTHPHHSPGTHCTPPPCSPACSTPHRMDTSLAAFPCTHNTSHHTTQAIQDSVWCNSNGTNNTLSAKLHVHVQWRVDVSTFSENLPVYWFVGGPTNRERVVLVIKKLVCVSWVLVTSLEDLTSLWGWCVWVCVGGGVCVCVCVCGEWPEGTLRILKHRRWVFKHVSVHMGK